MKKIALVFAAFSLLLLSSCGGGSASSSASLDELFLTRRSVRAYEAGKTISEAQVKELLTAVQNAPSWANQQPSKYYVAMTPEKVAALQDMIGSNKEKVINAPVLVVSTRASPDSSAVSRPMKRGTCGELMTTDSPTPTSYSRRETWDSILSLWE